MEWLLNHPEVLVALAGALAFLSKKRRQQPRDTSQSAGQGQPSRVFDSEDRRVDEEIRARQIREEMLRRRLQRAAGEGATNPPPAAQPPARSAVEPPQVKPPRPIEAPPPIFRDPLTEMMKEIARTLQPEEPPLPAAPEPPAPKDDTQERLRVLQARVAVLEREKVESEERVRIYGAVAGPAPTTSTGQDQASAAPLTDSLTGVEGLRRAIILSEILGKPVALR